MSSGMSKRPVRNSVGLNNKNGRRLSTAASTATSSTSGTSTRSSKSLGSSTASTPGKNQKQITTSGGSSSGSSLRGTRHSIGAAGSTKDLSNSSGGGGSKGQLVGESKGGNSFSGGGGKKNGTNGVPSTSTSLADMKMPIVSVVSLGPISPSSASILELLKTHVRSEFATLRAKKRQNSTYQGKLAWNQNMTTMKSMVF